MSELPPRPAGPRPGDGDPGVGELAHFDLDLVCVIPSLRAGGSERVLSGLASDLSGHGARVAILTLMEPDETPFYRLSGTVDLVGLGGLPPGGRLGSPRAFLQAAWRVRHALTARRGRLALGFTTLGSMLAVAATRGLDLPVVAAERVDPQAHARHIGRVRTLARDQLFARADHVVVQTERARRGLPWLPADRLSCIANPIHPVTGQARPGTPSPDGRFRLIGVGRLETQKGFDLLIEGFARVAARHPDWDLVIHGEGPERTCLEALAARAGLGDRIRLPGVTPSLEPEMLAAHALAFPSRFEGFPNALAEAMAAGLAVVGFPEVAGVDELIHEGDTGLLADWADPTGSLVHRLDALMGDAALRARLGANARAHVAAFRPQIHYEQWARLLTRLARPQPKADRRTGSA